jgi:sucrose phosphorylase
VFSGVHLLPFLHPIDGADAGFDPIDHTQVDARLGTWSDVHELSRHFDVMADVIVNHASSQSPQFLDYVANGSRSPYDGLFLTREAVFPQGVAYLRRILETFAANGIRMVRLDAVGYAIKQAGTSCFMLPETFAFIETFAAQARALGIEVLVEIHSHYRTQVDIARRVDWVYDFALPPLVLHAVSFETAQHLQDWIAVRPANALTVLDTHDGIGVIDVGADPTDRTRRPGLVPPDELDRLVEIVHDNSGGQSRAATGAAASNLDLYQVNCTFLDALGRCPLRHLLARAIQLFLPGVPQVYYVGLLAGSNDMDLLAKSGVGRDINRHHYSRAEIAADLQRTEVKDLLDLIRLRNSHPAFNGRFESRDSASSVLHLRWQEHADFVELHVDFATLEYRIAFSSARGEKALRFVSAARR